MKVQVKVGSNMVSVSVKKETLCSDLIRKTLNQVGITNLEDSGSKLAKYTMFEVANGIERMMSSGENVHETVLKLNSQQINNFQFAIRLCRRSKALRTKMQTSSQILKKLQETKRSQANNNVANNPIASSLIEKSSEHGKSEDELKETSSYLKHKLINKLIKGEKKLVSVFKNLKRQKSSSSQNSNQHLIQL